MPFTCPAACVYVLQPAGFFVVSACSVSYISSPPSFVARDCLVVSLRRQWAACQSVVSLRWVVLVTSCVGRSGHHTHNTTSRGRRSEIHGRGTVGFETGSYCDQVPGLYQALPILQSSLGVCCFACSTALLSSGAQEVTHLSSCSRRQLQGCNRQSSTKVKACHSNMSASLRSGSSSSACCAKGSMQSARHHLLLRPAHPITRHQLHRVQVASTETVTQTQTQQPKSTSWAPWKVLNPFGGKTQKQKQEAIPTISEAELWQLLEAEQTVPLVVIFSATWCGPCKIMMARLESLMKTLGPSGIRAVKIDTDDSPDLASELKVCHHTLVAFGGSTTVCVFAPASSAAWSPASNMCRPAAPTNAMCAVSPPLHRSTSCRRCTLPGLTPASQQHTSQA